MVRPQHRSLKFPLEKDLKEAQQSLSQIGARLRMTAFRPLPAAAPPMHPSCGAQAADMTQRPRSRSERFYAFAMMPQYGASFASFERHLCIGIKKAAAILSDLHFENAHCRYTGSGCRSGKKTVGCRNSLPFF